MSERRPVHPNMRLIRILVPAEVVDDANTISRVRKEPVSNTYRRLIGQAILEEVTSAGFLADMEALKAEREAATGEPVSEEQAAAARMLIKAVPEDETSVYSSVSSAAAASTGAAGGSGKSLIDLSNRHH